MTCARSELVDDIDRAVDELITRLDLLAEGCDHTDVVECYRDAGDFTYGGYLWRCTHCLKEHHGWSLYPSPKTKTVVTWGEFIQGRLKYAPLRMMGGS